MTLFTKNPLELLMMQRPYPGKEETPRTPAPEGHFCCGCARYGTVSNIAVNYLGNIKG